MLISYSSLEEVIVCSIEKESQIIKDYFNEGGRDIDNYDRYEIPGDILEIKAGLSIYD